MLLVNNLMAGRSNCVGWSWDFKWVLFTLCSGVISTSFFWLQCGVDANATDRVLLQSSKPSLHTNVNCTALVAAVVSRKISIVRFLLQVIFST